MGLYTFGPVPSRRLGKSLGVNNIPPKVCSYSCIYCQLGRTLKYSVERENYYDPRAIAEEVISVVKSVKRGKIDVITFVPDGEPTLDINLGKCIDMIKEGVSKRVAVISNSSLIYREDVIEDLLKADIVSLKIDALTEDIFKRIDRPHPTLKLDRILNGMLEFRKIFKGKLYTETMMVKDVNDADQHLDMLIEFIKRLKPNKAFIAVPIRPPAEKWVRPSDPDKLIYIYNKLNRYMPNRIELLNYREDGEFGIETGNPIDEFVNIVSVHPMRIEDVYKFFEKRDLDPEKTIKILLEMGDIILINYEDTQYVIRKLLSRRTCPDT